MLSHRIIIWLSLENQRFSKESHEITILTLNVSSKTNPIITTIEDEFLDKTNLDLLREKYPVWNIKETDNQNIKDFIYMDNLHWNIAKIFFDMKKDEEYDFIKFAKIDRIYTEIRKLEKPFKKEYTDLWFN
jgi:hypothetical protein